jgi:DNA repair protein RadC
MAVLAAVQHAETTIDAPVAELIERFALTPSAARQVAAACTLARHIMMSAPDPSPAFEGAADVATYLRPRLLGLRQECVWVLAVDVANRLLGEFEVARGTLTEVSVHPREVFRPLIRMAAAAAILVHNHPSGDPTPSALDLDLTQRMRRAAMLLGIPLLDHVVIARGGYVSVADLGWPGPPL